MIVLPYEPADLLGLDLRDYERSFLADFADREAYAEILRQGAAFTLCKDVPIGCFGILRLRPGVGEGWLCLSNALPIGQASRDWARAVTLIERQLTVEMGRFHRVQVALPARFAAGQRLVRRLGFELEGVLRRYGADGSDFISYARFD